MKLTSLATVHKHITTLEKKGFIRRGYNQSRSIEILQLPKSVKEQVIERKIQELPLVGRIAAGRPLEAVEERETISLGDFARGGNSFVLQVKGSSMIEDHIMDGDFVVCEQTQVANPGRDRGGAGERRRSDAEEVLSRRPGEDPVAAGELGNGADHRPGQRREDSGPRDWRAQKILIVGKSRQEAKAEREAANRPSFVLYGPRPARLEPKPQTSATNAARRESIM